MSQDPAVTKFVAENDIEWMEPIKIVEGVAREKTVECERALSVLSAEKDEQFKKILNNVYERCTEQTSMEDVFSEIDKELAQSDASASSVSSSALKEAGKK